MSLSAAQLNTIQQAGLALHHANQTVLDAMRVQAQTLVDYVSVHPMEMDSEFAFAQFRQLASLSQELTGMEDRLKALFSAAAEQRRDEKINATATARMARKSRFTVGQGKTPVRPRAKMPLVPRALSPNDLKVLNYFKTTLKTTEWTPLTGAIVAAGAGLPKGSVGVSINRVVASGAVRKGDGGTFQLAGQ